MFWPNGARHRLNIVEVRLGQSQWKYGIADSTHKVDLTLLAVYSFKHPAVRYGAAASEYCAFSTNTAINQLKFK
jgi:hypothetical protein